MSIALASDKGCLRGELTRVHEDGTDDVRAYAARQGRYAFLANHLHRGSEHEDESIVRTLTRKRASKQCL